jgi:hypothetical protein
MDYALFADGGYCMLYGMLQAGLDAVWLTLHAASLRAASMFVE